MFLEDDYLIAVFTLTGVFGLTLTELDPKMVLRWARELNRKDLDQLDGTSIKQAKFVPTAEDYAELAKENEKLKKLYAEQALERDILKDLLKKTNPHLRIK